MGRHRKPDALSNAEHHRRHVQKHGLKSLRITPEVAEALSIARDRTKRTKNQILLSALTAYLASMDGEGMPVAGVKARLRTSKAFQKSPSVSNQLSLFSDV
jgi:predicted DNA-binding protein